MFVFLRKLNAEEFHLELLFTVPHKNQPLFHLKVIYHLKIYNYYDIFNMKLHYHIVMLFLDKLMETEQTEENKHVFETILLKGVVKELQNTAQKLMSLRVCLAPTHTLFPFCYCGLCEIIFLNFLCLSPFCSLRF